MKNTKKKNVAAAKGKGRATLSAQQTIPYLSMHPDGVCKLPGGLYTKTVEYEDINYSVAYNHDKIIREFKQRCRKIGILHFPYGGYFFCFSSIIFLTQKDPCRSHFCERQRPSTTYDLIRSGEMGQRSHSTGSVSPFRFLTIPGVPDAAFSCSIRRRTASMMYSVTLFPSFWAAT